MEHKTHWYFDPKEIIRKEKESAPYKPYICLACQNQTMLDKGKCFVCLLCGCEWEFIGNGDFQEFRREIRKELMNAIPAYS